jgi:hypothetical protein
MLQSYKEEVDTLNEALKIAAMDIAEVGQADDDDDYFLSDDEEGNEVDDITEESRTKGDLYMDAASNEFDKQKCRDSFEEKRTIDMAEVLTKQASLQEESVLNPNYKEQYIYIGIGAVVLLLGLYVVSKKTKK